MCIESRFSNSVLGQYNFTKTNRGHTWQGLACAEQRQRGVGTGIRGQGQYRGPSRVDSQGHKCLSLHVEIAITPRASPNPKIKATGSAGERGGNCHEQDNSTRSGPLKWTTSVSETFPFCASTYRYRSNRGAHRSRQYGNGIAGYIDIDTPAPHDTGTVRTDSWS
ncbi:hypothetical protein J6590_037767 [Homalodisca vitripennis]|nr:hypothetical protein J6590_037767 [Homalodisca vitripennis]